MNGQLFDTSDEGVGAAAAATATAAVAGASEGGADELEGFGTAEGADDGRRHRWRSATAAGAFSGRPAALLDDLTLPQRAAVEHRGGPLLIVAGAGSGKTRVLTRRIAHLLATGDAPPWGILAITFTNKAADEMRSRVLELVGPAADKMWVSTFHSACLRILRTNADRLGYRSAFTVYDDTDSRRLVEVITAELGFDQKRLPSRAVQGVISQAKSELVDFETFREEAHAGPDPFRKRIADVYVQYQQRLHAANALDFDDLLMATANLLQACDDVREAYQERFRHILVDEFQDTNHAQNEIVKLLGEAHGNVCVVGDSDQSVYRWRGADIRNILEFERAFPNVTTILLEQNFRSTQTILDAANAVIANNIGRQPKELFTVGDTGGPIKRYRAEDERDEAAWVSSEILRLHASEGLSWGDVAVFYRTNAQSLPLETSMKFSGIPYKVVGGAKFYDRREIKDVLAYIRVLANPDDEVSARRIVNVPKRGIGDTSVARLAAWAQIEGVTFSEAIDRAAEAGLSGKALKGAEALAALLAELRPLVHTVNPADFVQLVADRTGYLAELVAEHTHEADGRIENLAELATQAADFDDVTGFLETVALVADSDELESDGTRVSLMTLHTAKGLEYPAVFVVGLEEGIFPHFRSLSEPSELEEERRLFYVGITRARRHLAISHAWSRTTWGRTQAAMPSRFVTEVPSHLVEEVGLGSPRRGTGYDTLSAEEHLPGATFAPAVPLAARAGAAARGGRGPGGSRGSTGAEELGLQAGDDVVHEHWGHGVVLATKGEGSRAQATVDFDSVGKKNLLLSATPLRRA
ncbi:MAG TPA: UvrD-helicase domain-containing protein [Acidimicrobiales bacterium]|nr:UvrD-helicase domain-containing protein [Acidimicrobiales bacterium]